MFNCNANLFFQKISSPYFPDKFLNLFQKLIPTITTSNADETNIFTFNRQEALSHKISQCFPSIHINLCRCSSFASIYAELKIESALCLHSRLYKTKLFLAVACLRCFISISLTLKKKKKMLASACRKRKQMIISLKRDCDARGSPTFTENISRVISLKMGP